MFDSKVKQMQTIVLGKEDFNPSWKAYWLTSPIFILQYEVWRRQSFLQLKTFLTKTLTTSKWEHWQLMVEATPKGYRYAALK